MCYATIYVHVPQKRKKMSLWKHFGNNESVKYEVFHKNFRVLKLHLRQSFILAFSVAEVFSDNIL